MDEGKIAVLRWESGQVPQGLLQLETMPGNTPLKEAAERLGFDSAQSYCHWRRKIRSGGGRTAPPEQDGAAKGAAVSAGARRPEG